MMTDNDRTDSAENLGSEATCIAGCDCNTSSSCGRARWITGIVILVVAGGLVVRAVIKDNGTKIMIDEAEFAVIATAEGAGEDVSSVPLATELSNKGIVMIAGTEIATLTDLSKLAAEMDGVFMYLPGKDTETANSAPTSQIEAAVKTIKAQGVALGIFTLRTDAPEYIQLASQMAVPGVITMMKGGGMVPVNGNITENSLIQSFVAASSASGCGPSSSACGPSGCN